MPEVIEPRDTETFAESNPISKIGEKKVAVVGHMVVDGVLQRTTNRRYDIGNQKSMAEVRSDGLCAQTDPEAFFPEKGGSTREAKRVCAQCEVKEDCLEISLLQGERFGIWGGLSERERRKLSSAVISFSI